MPNEGSVQLTPPRRIHELLPREQAGPVSGKGFEFQYHRAAQACLELIEDTGAGCVFCEWHDDYVVESSSGSATLYGFHQVKTRTLKNGAWPLREVFGLGRKLKIGKVKAADGTAIVPRLVDHYFNFSESCQRVVLITNAGINADFEAFVADVQQAGSLTALSADGRTFFDEVLQAYQQLPGTFSTLTDESLFSFLKRLMVQPEAASYGKSQDDLESTLGKRIRELSEIDLRVTETVKIGKELVDLVRAKSHAVLKALPNDQDLRNQKGVQRDEVLRILALSPEAYRVLRASGKNVLLSLSRLYRLCERCGIPKDLIVEICQYKTKWDAWYLQERHQIEDTDYSSLKARCITLLTAHSQGGLPFDKLAEEAQSLATEFNPKLSGVQLTRDLLMGFFFSIAAESAE